MKKVFKKLFFKKREGLKFFWLNKPRRDTGVVITIKCKPLLLWPSTIKEVSFMTHAKWPWKTLQLVGHESLFLFFYIYFYLLIFLKKGRLNYPILVFIFYFSAFKDCLQKHVQKWLHLKRQALLTQSPKSIRPKVLPKKDQTPRPSQGTGQNWPLDCFSVHLTTIQDIFFFRFFTVWADWSSIGKTQNFPLTLLLFFSYSFPDWH